MTGNMKPSREAVCWSFCSLVPSGSRGQQQDAAVLKPRVRARGSGQKQEPEGDCRCEHPAFLPSPSEPWQPHESAPCLRPLPLSLLCLLPLKAAEGLLMLLGATKNFYSFWMKLGSPDRGRWGIGHWLPRSLPTTLAAFNIQPFTAFGKIPVPPAWRDFLSIFPGDAHFRDRNA